MDLKAFTKMLENMTTWAKPSPTNNRNSDNMQVIEEISESFILRLFNYFKSDYTHIGITLADAVSKLGEILRGVSTCLYSVSAL